MCLFRFLFDSALRSGKLCVAVLRKTKRRAPAPPPQQDNASVQGHRNSSTQQGAPTAAGRNMDNKNGHIATLPRTAHAQEPNGLHTKKLALSGSAHNLAHNHGESSQGSSAAVSLKGKAQELASPVTVARSDSVLSKMLPEVKRKVGVGLKHRVDVTIEHGRLGWRTLKCKPNLRTLVQCGKCLFLVVWH